MVEVFFILSNFGLDHLGSGQKPGHTVAHPLGQAHWWDNSY